MTVIIGEKNAQEVSRILSEKLRRPKKAGNLVKRFGKLKRNIDGLTYQQEVRENEI